MMVDPISIISLVITVTTLANKLYAKVKKVVKGQNERAELATHVETILRHLDMFDSEWASILGSPFSNASFVYRRKLNEFLKELRKDKVDHGLEGLAESVATASVTFSEELNKLQILKTLTVAQDTRYLRQADDLASQQDIEQFLKYPEDSTFESVPDMPDEFRGTFQGQAVIYKRLPKTADDRERVLELRRHLAVLRTLSNFDYVQKFYGLVLRSEDDGQYTYAIMEDVRQPLVDVLGSLSAERKLNIAMQLAWTIKSLHAGGIVHKGISCENVFLTEDLKPRLSGFEQSRKILSESDKKPLVLRYEALEVLEGKGHSYATDVYSFGVLLWQLQYAKVPFAAVESGNAKDFFRLIKHRHSFADDLPRSPPLGSEYEDLITSCCIQSPGRRLTMHEVASRLKHLVDPDSIVDLWTIASKLHNEYLDELERGSSDTEAATKAFKALRICAEITDDWRAWYYLAVYVRFDHGSWREVSVLELPNSQTQSREVHEGLGQSMPQNASAKSLDEFPAKFQCVLKCLSKTLEGGNVRAVFDVVEIARGIPKEVIRYLRQTDNWSEYRTSVLFPKDLEEYGKARGKIDEVADGQAARSEHGHDHGNAREFLLLARGVLSQKEAVLKDRASTFT